MSANAVRIKHQQRFENTFLRRTHSYALFAPPSSSRASEDIKIKRKVPFQRDPPRDRATTWPERLIVAFLEKYLSLSRSNRHSSIVSRQSKRFFARFSRGSSGNSHVARTTCAEFCVRSSTRFRPIQTRYICAAEGGLSRVDTLKRVHSGVAGAS